MTLVPFAFPSALRRPTLPDGPKPGVIHSIRELFRLRVDKSTARVGLVSLAFMGLFTLIAGRLVMLAVVKDEGGTVRRAASSEISAARPDIVDRNGEVLATDVKTV